jgi:ATP-dependent Clp protease protease subunit
MLYSKVAVVNSLMDKIAEKCKTARPAVKAEPKGRSVDDLYERLNLLKH